MKTEKKFITIIFSIEQYDWLKQAKKKRMQSISAILREFVNEAMANEKAKQP